MAEAQLAPQDNLAPAQSGLIPSGTLAQRTEEFEKKAGEIETEMGQAEKQFGELKPPELQQIPSPHVEPTDPKEIWGSAAMALAALGSLMTRQPLTTALNAGTEVFKAVRQGDAARANQAFQTWKVASENATKLADYQLNQYKAAMEEAKDKIEAGSAKIKALATAYQDPNMAQAADQRNTAMIERLIIAQGELSERIASQMPVIQEKGEQLQLYHDLQSGQKDLAAAQQTKDPAKIKAASDHLQDVMQSAKNLNLAFGKGGAAGSTTLSDDDIASAGAQAATGMPLSQILPGFGNQAIAIRQQIRAEAIKQIRDENPGMTAAQAGGELANRNVMYVAGKQSVGQLEKMVGATKQAVGQLDFNVDKATEEIKKLGSSDISPVINAIARGEEKWTGNPAYYGLFYYMHASAVESARILSGGQASTAQLHQGAMEQAQQWANVNLTPSSWAEVGSAMKAEGRNRLQQYQDAVDYQSGLTGGSKGGAPKKGAVEGGYEFLGGDPGDKKNWRKVQ